MYIYANPNPKRKTVGDCVIRGISIITDQSWSIVYKDLCDLGFKLHDMPSSNAVWSEYLFEKGFERIVIPDTCPMCYTVNWRLFIRNRISCSSSIRWKLL